MSPRHSIAFSRRDVIALALLTALTLLFFWRPAFTDLVIARGDIFTYFIPYREAAAQALRGGRVPLWNPQLFMGAPLLANSQAGVFYPINLLMTWLDTARAVNWTIVLHVIIAASGAYVLARQRLRLSIPAAWLAAVSFGLGGYLGAQVEHVNQLQGLAWLGWLFWAYDRVIGDRRSAVSGRWTLLLAILIALQLLAGHTQSVFISLIGLGVYALWQLLEAWRASKRFHLLLVTRYLVPLVSAVLFAVALSAVQLLPTLELTPHSARSGGLPTNLAVSFSLDPRLLGRALLPDYAGALPAGGEFTAFFSVAVLLLMALGALQFRHGSGTLRAVTLLAGAGLFLAFGGYNPIYYLLLNVPGFDLFRAPARWLVLLAFAGSLLAGAGLDALRERRIDARSLGISIGGVLIFIALTFISADLIPAGATGPIGAPDILSLLSWLAAIGLVASLYFVLRRLFITPRSSHVTRYSFLMLLLSCLELFLATRPLTYHSRATAREALTDLRPAQTFLLAKGQAAAPPDRFLSISDIQFDPGDTPELASIYGDQLSAAAFYDLIVATKAKEVLAPNLPLYYGVPAVDGYDGGVLPLRTYLEFQRLLLDSDLIQSDGRLREQLTAIPDARWLNLMNARYILTDKVGDQWYDDVLYDLQFTTPIGSGAKLFTDQMPRLKADALGVVYTASGGDRLAQIEVTFADGVTQTLALLNRPREIKDGLAATRLAWDEPRRVTALRVRGIDSFVLRGLALIDQTGGAFESFVLAPQGRFRVAFSGDVKIYENVDALPRAFCVTTARRVADDEEALAVMQQPGFDPAREVVLVETSEARIEEQEAGVDQPVSRSACHLIIYEPERVVVETDLPHAAYLVLTDAYYPGWTAMIDGEPVTIERADVAFRAVRVPAGAQRVEFRFEPQSFSIGAAISIGALLMLGVRLMTTRRAAR